ncbi:carbon-nitrogen hydrolase family protein [Alteromonas ponticola]|uniref:Carbon-nitrogen hydrolase family protein n=1 Tax=Alteromonas ponticola TaxID=2720613 RepID=A0ABX1R2Y0_9ALTE|nr:carbon-nitrogen hydrolase family protein [Alteromonas ponticola]NMH60266.1 carbon-nitrogen hydrolase family protein [Alteromonas ponticola]
MTVMSIAGLQLALPANQNNFDTIAREVSSVKKRFPHVGMVVLSELATFGPAPRHAEPLPGDTEARYAKLAAQTGVWLVNGSLFERAENRVYNTTSVMSPDGEVVARYRKMFPFLPYEEGISAGSEPCVFTIPGLGTIGLSICYDMWFPETVRALCWQGAEVIIHPTLTNTIDRDVELSIARSNAATNQCYMVDINAASPMGVGRSIIVGPGGEVIHQSTGEHDVILFDVDFALVRRVRERGWQGLGQPLKSFRDHPVAYPQYQPDARSKTLDGLGPLKKPDNLA